MQQKRGCFKFTPSQLTCYLAKMLAEAVCENFRFLTSEMGFDFIF